jgi:hypothetical protein
MASPARATLALVEHSLELDRQQANVRAGLKFASPGSDIHKRLLELSASLCASQSSLLQDIS